ncbi:epsilon subunit of F1F0-ATP synthase N-terminal domain-containing protein [Lactarius deliciosus]|nr:epsilon subunit of F1F0-ATP synthase N-terminal domain-containing protein [Lactarius deliciosus]
MDSHARELKSLPVPLRVWLTAKCALLLLSHALPHEQHFQATKKYVFKCHCQIVDNVGHAWPVNALAFHPTYNTFASSGSDATVSIWGHKVKQLLSFATVHPNNKLTINAIEAAILKDFSLEAIRASLREAQEVLSDNGPEEDKAEARIEADVYESLQHTLGTK